MALRDPLGAFTARNALRLPQAPDEPFTQEERQSLVQTVTEPVLSGLETLGNTLDIPGAIVRGILAGDPRAAVSPIMNPFGSEGRITGRQLLRQAGLVGPRDTWGNWGVGILGEIALDPLTYVAGPAAALTKAGRFTRGLGLMDDISKIATTKMAKQAALKSAPDVMTPSQLRQIMEAPVGVPARRIGQAEAKQMLTGEDILRSLPKERMGEARDLLSSMGLTPADIAKQQLGSVVGAGLPFRDPSWVWSGRRAQQASQFLDELGPGLRSIPGIGWTMEHLADPIVSVFDARAQQMATPATRRAARQAFRGFEQAEPEAMFKTANWMDRLEKAGIDPNDVSEMYRVLEMTDPTQVPKDWRPIYDEIHKDLGQIVEEAPEWALPFTTLKDQFNRYIPAHTTHAKRPTGKPKLAEVLDPSDPSYQARLDITRHIKGGHKTLRDIFMDPELNRIIDGVAEGADDPLTDVAQKAIEDAGEAASTADQVSAVLAMKYGDKLPEVIDSKGTYFPDMQTAQELGEGPFKEAPQIAAELGDWMSSMTSEARKKGYYDVNPLIGIQNRVLAAKQAVEASKAIHDFMMEPGILRASEEGTESMWDVASSMGLEPGKFVNNIARRRGDEAVIDGIVQAEQDKWLLKQAKDADAVKSGEMSPSQWIESNRDNLDIPAFEAKAIKQYGKSLGMDAKEAANLRSWNLGFTAPKDAAKITQFMDRFLNAFRTGVTTPWPAFVTRNLLSGQWQNFIAGMFSPQDTIDAYRLVRGGTINNLSQVPLMRRLWNERQLAAMGESPDSIRVPPKPERPQPKPAPPEMLGPRPEEIEVPPLPTQPATMAQPDQEALTMAQSALDVAQAAKGLAGDAAGTAADRPLHYRIVDEYYKHQERGGKRRMTLAELRKLFPDVPHDEMSEAIWRAQREGFINLERFDAPWDITPEVEAAQLINGVGEPRHMIAGAYKPAPKATPKSAAASLNKRQMTSVATMLATNTLEGSLPRLEQAGPEWVEFAKQIDRYYKKRDGFVPKQVTKIINEAKEVNPAKQAPQQAQAGIPLIQVHRALGGDLGEFSGLVQSLKDRGLLVTTDDGKRILPDETLAKVQEFQKNPPSIEVPPSPDDVAAYQQQLTAYQDAIQKKQAAQQAHDNPPMAEPTPEELARYKQEVAEYRRAKRAYRQAVERHSAELRDPTDQEATELFRELLYGYRIAGKYQGQAPGVLAGVDNADTLEAVRQGIPGHFPFDYGNVGQKAMGRAPGTTITGRGDVPLQFRGVTGPSEAIHRDTTFGPLAAAEDLNYMVEALNRISPFLNQIRKGVSPYEAARRVGGAQVRYGNRYYTPTEREVLARAFPFWKFSSKVLPWHLEKLVSQPGGPLRRSIQLANEGKGETDLQPQYVAESASIPIGNALGPVPEGTDRYLTGFGVMVEDPAALIGDLRPRTFFGELLSRANPLLRLPAEVAAQELFFQRGPGGGREMVDVDPTIGRTISNLQELAADPKALLTGGKSGAYRPAEIPGGRSLDYLLLNSPAARFFTTLRGLTDLRKSPAAKALQYGTGLRITDVSEAARDAVLRENVEEYMLENMQGRPFESIYIPEWQKERMGEQQLQQAEALQLLLRDVRARAQQRKQQEQAARS